MNSSHDMLAQVAVLLRMKAPKVLGDEAKRRGLSLPHYMDALPDNKKKAMMTLRMIDARYITGDYTHNDKEVGTIERVANWLIELHQTAHGHPVRPIAIRQGDMQSKKPLQDGRYPDGKKRPKGFLYREIMEQVPSLGQA